MTHKYKSVLIQSLKSLPANAIFFLIGLVVILLAAGCGPDDGGGPKSTPSPTPTVTPAPPGSSEVFLKPAAGSNFGVHTGTVILSALDGLSVCYTTDGSAADYNGGSCGGSAMPYVGGIDLSCGAEEEGVTTRFVNISFEFAGNEVALSAEFALVCGPIKFSITGNGALSNAAGTISGTVDVQAGSATLYQDSGILDIETHDSKVRVSLNGNLTASILADWSGEIFDGNWDAPDLTAPIGAFGIEACAENTDDTPALAACGFVTVPTDPPWNMGITTDPISFDGAPGATTLFSISTSILIVVSVDLSLDYTLTSLTPLPPVYGSMITEKLNVTSGSQWEIKEDFTGGAWEALVEDSLQISCAYDYPCDTALATVTDGGLTYIEKTYSVTAPSCPYNPPYCDIHVNDQTSISRYPDTQVVVRLLASSGSLSAQPASEAYTVTCVDSEGVDTMPPIRLLGHSSDLTTTAPGIMYLGFNPDGFMYAEGGTLLAMFGMPSPVAGILDCEPNTLLVDGVPIE